MCGLIITINLPFDARVRDLLAHRGPDDAGLTSRRIGPHFVQIGHRRLAIVDLSAAGHQPMEGESGVVLAYNGEVYNHLDLRDRLPARVWRGHSDTETVLAWLEQYELQGLGDLNGIFALALADPRHARVVLARDPFGVKPLYYAVIGNRLVAASELAPLRALVGSDVEADHVALLLRLRYLPSPYTLFRDIRKLAPGAALIVDLSRPDLTVREVPYVVPAVPARSALSFDDAVTRYSELVGVAVRRQMMADTEVGVLLSGGLDSALVAHWARDASPGRVRAFTVGFEGQYRENEIDDARETARVLGVDCHTRVVTLDDFLASLREVAGMVEEPLATTSVVPMHFLARLAADHVKVVLSGQGADEPLGGYGRHYGMLLADWLPAELAPLGVMFAKLLGIRNEQVLRGLETARWSDGRERLLAAWQVFPPDEIEALTGTRERLAAEVVGRAWAQWPVPEDRPLVARMLRLDLRLNLADDLLTYTDRLTMRHSLECRVPYLDHDLIGFLEGLPLGHKIGLRGGKRVHRAAATRLLPAAIVNRPKRGFEVPTRKWFRNTELLNRVFAEEGAALSQYVDPDGVRQILEQHAAGFNREKQLFLLLMLAFVLPPAGANLRTGWL